MYLYLDTARLGQMCPEAQAADRDFARLAGEEAGSLYFDLFLRGGFHSLPPSLRSRYPGLSDWSGVAALKNRIKIALGLPPERPAFLASRSAQLVRLAARALCSRCENILVTDMFWPSYRRILQDECRRRGRRLTTVALREPILQQDVRQQELVDRFVDCYAMENCDGTFLSAVTCEGIRMPVRELARATAQVSRLRFIAVDAAQAMNHAPLDLGRSYCDFVIAGCHKWVRAYHPMGVGFCCRSSSEESIRMACRDMQEQGDLDDPLLSLTTELEIDRCQPFSETVNLAPVFTASAAVGRIWAGSQCRHQAFSCQLDNANRAADISQRTGWLHVRPSREMRSGILLLQARNADTRLAPPDSLRLGFRRRGIAVSAYKDGLIRASLPPTHLGPAPLKRLRLALELCA